MMVDTGIEPALRAAGILMGMIKSKNLRDAGLVLANTMLGATTGRN
jgi:hypothetical protein